jgi:hypothetical protein
VRVDELGVRPAGDELTDVLLYLSDVLGLDLVAATRSTLRANHERFVAAEYQRRPRVGRQSL